MCMDGCITLVIDYHTEHEMLCDNYYVKLKAKLCGDDATNWTEEVQNGIMHDD